VIPFSVCLSASPAVSVIHVKARRAQRAQSVVRMVPVVLSAQKTLFYTFLPQMLLLTKHWRDLLSVAATISKWLSHVEVDPFRDANSFDNRETETPVGRTQAQGNSGSRNGHRSLEGVPPEMLLAYAIAHKVEHLLGAVHESLGIMQGHWSSQEMPQIARAYLLHFSRKQRDRLRAEVLDRRRSRQQPMSNRYAP
jgi:hypothetical protein